MFTKWVLLWWLWFVILAGLYPFWRVCLVSFWREQTYVGIHMDNFGRQKFDSDGQLCASDTQTDTQTDRHTDTLLIFISIDAILVGISVVVHC